MHQSDLTFASVVARSPGVLHAEVDQEVVALSIERGTCYGLNGVGSRIWQLLETPMRVDDICSALLREYDVAPETCRRQVMDLLKEALVEGMITRSAAGEPKPRQSQG